MGYEVFVFNKYGREIDFLAQKDGKEYLIQTAYSIAEEKTYQREFALFHTLDQSRRKIIITTDEFDYSTSTVRHISLAKFLELNSLEDGAVTKCSFHAEFCSALFHCAIKRGYRLSAKIACNPAICF